VACHFAEELLPGARRDQLIADAARTSSPFATAEDEAAGIEFGPAVAEPDPFDPGDGGSEGAHGRL
jgi:hypothetical protein